MKLSQEWAYRRLSQTCFNADQAIPAELLDPRLAFTVMFKSCTVEGEYYNYEPATNIWLQGQETDRDSIPGPIEHARLGSTGYLPATKTVLWLGLDIDGKSHETTGFTSAQIETLLLKLRTFPWLYIRRSRSGTGLHLFAIPLQPIVTENPRAYSASLIDFISETIPDFGDYIDCHGQNLHLTAPEVGERGFVWEQVGKGTVPIALQPVYSVPNQSRKALPVEDLDVDHKRLIDWLSANHSKAFKRCAGRTTFHVHTSDLARAHSELKLLGAFNTNATGHGDPESNSHMTACSNGVWFVSKFNGCLNESTPWFDRQGASACWLNHAPSLRDFKAQNNLRGKYLTRELALQLATLYRIELPSCPPEVKVAEVNGEIVLTSSIAQVGWAKQSSKSWTYSIDLPEESVSTEDLIRVGRYAEGGHSLYFRQYGNHWQDYPRSQALSWLRANGVSGSKADLALETPDVFTLTNEPLAVEYPSPRVWNRTKTKFRFSPVTGDYRHFQLILDHIGHAFDTAVTANDWCNENGIRTGADYLFVWAAKLFQSPKTRLPGIGLFSEKQCTGKSSFADSLTHLLTFEGYVSGRSFFDSTFNGNLAGAVLFNCDDTNLSVKNEQIYSKLQPLMTASTFDVNSKGKDERKETNYLHFVHTTNNTDYFATNEGDQRWVYGEVGKIECEISKSELETHWTKEGPAFLHALLNKQLPTSSHRLFLPVLDTKLKQSIVAGKQDGLTYEQRLVVSRLMQDAPESWATAKQLQPLIGIGHQKLSSNWEVISAELRENGFRTECRPATNGKSVTTYLITKNGGI